MSRTLRPGVHGYVDLSKFPYEIGISKDQPYGRAELAFVHEMVHIGSKTLKVPLNEQQTHAFAFFIQNEILPGLKKFRQKYEEAGEPVPDRWYDEQENEKRGETNVY